MVCNSYVVEFCTRLFLNQRQTTRNTQDSDSFCSCNLDVAPMTLKYKLNLMYVHIKQTL